LIEPATALSQHEESGECHPGKEAEYTEDDWEGGIGIKAKHQARERTHSGPGYCPSEAHPDCTANAPRPLPHDRLRSHRRAPATSISIKHFVVQSTTGVCGFRCAQLASTIQEARAVSHGLGRPNPRRRPRDARSDFFAGSEA